MRVEFDAVGRVSFGSHRDGEGCTNEGAGVLADNHIEHVHDGTMGAFLDFGSEDDVDDVVVVFGGVEGEDVEVVALSLDVPGERGSGFSGLFAFEFERIF